MAKESARKQIAALLYEGEALYFVRRKGEEGLSLPCLAAPKAFPRHALTQHFRKQYGVECYIKMKLPQIEVTGHSKTYVQAYLIDAKMPKEAGDYEFLALEEGDPLLDQLDPISQGVAKRGYIFLPFYISHIRTVPLFPEDQEKVYWQIQCLRYFVGKKIPRDELYDFEGLVDSAASLTRINAAFALICNRYHADPKEYVRHLEYREKHRKELR